MWVIQLAGWMAMCAMECFFTTVWAQSSGASPEEESFASSVRLAAGLLLAQAAVYTAVGFELPRIVALLGGEFSATLATMPLIAGSLLSFILCPLPVAGAVAVVVYPVAAQIMRNTPFA